MPYADHRIAEYERCLLGAYIMGADIGERITKDVFVSGAHKLIFRTVKSLRERGLEPDLIILVSELERAGRLDESGGAAYIAELTNGAASIANLTFYENEVLTAWRGREALRALESAREAIQRGQEPDDVFSKMTSDIETIAPSVNAAVFGSDLDDNDSPLEKTEYIVDGFLAKGSRTMLFGESGSGKSFVGIDLAYSVACGIPFMGHETKKGVVWYLALEGRQGLRARARAWQTVRGVNAPSGSVLLNSRGIDLQGAESVQWLCNCLKTAKEKPDLLIIDTWAEALGADDSDTTASRTGQAALSKIQGCGDFALLVIHHCGHGDKSRARGASSLFATLDHCYRLEEKKDGERLLVSTKQKDMEAPPPVAFRLKKIALLAQGGIVNSAAIELIDDLPEVMETRSTKLSNTEATVLDAIDQAGDAGLTQAALRTACPGVDRRVFPRIKKSLVEKKLICFDGQTYKRHTVTPSQMMTLCDACDAETVQPPTVTPSQASHTPFRGCDAVTVMTVRGPGFGDLVMLDRKLPKPFRNPQLETVPAGAPVEELAIW
jgi:hypothetical protein